MPTTERAVAADGSVMTSRRVAGPRGAHPLAAPLRDRLPSRAALVDAAVYLASFVALDRLSGASALSGAGFALWNPAPACSLALLLTCGLRFIPLLPAAEILADAANGGFAVGLVPALAADAVLALGYAALAVWLRRAAQGQLAFRTVRGVVAFLASVGAGILLIGGALAMVTEAVQAASPAALPAIRHFWIGDVTGVVGLLPAILVARDALRHWPLVPARTRVADLAAFAGGLAGALWMIFGVAEAGEFQFFYLLLLPVIWIAARHGLAWCAIAILIAQLALVGVVVWLDYPAHDFSTFQALSLAISGTGLILGAGVTEGRRAERDLRQHQLELARMSRMATAGALGTAMIHELSQPLATIATYAHVCRRLLRSGSGQRELLARTSEKLEAEVQRAGVIIERLRDFLARGRLVTSRLDLAKIARRVADSLAPEAAARGVEIEVSAPPAWCVADPVQIELVLVNLVRNAIDAASRRAGGRGQVCVALNAEGAAVRATVADNGPGLSAAVAGRLFDPFVSDKPRGMGLGLVLSRQIVAAHGGELWCDASTTQGTRFAFRIPAEGPAHAGA